VSPEELQRRFHRLAGELEEAAWREVRPPAAAAVRRRGRIHRGTRLAAAAALLIAVGVSLPRVLPTSGEQVGPGRPALPDCGPETSVPTTTVPQTTRLPTTTWLPTTTTRLPTTTTRLPTTTSTPQTTRSPTTVPPPTLPPTTGPVPTGTPTSTGLQPRGTRVPSGPVPSETSAPCATATTR
jgi:hypothetical protein